MTPHPRGKCHVFCDGDTMTLQPQRILLFFLSSRSVPDASTCGKPSLPDSSVGGPAGNGGLGAEPIHGKRLDCRSNEEQPALCRNADADCFCFFLISHGTARDRQGQISVLSRLEAEGQGPAHVVLHRAGLDAVERIVKLLGERANLAVADGMILAVVVQRADG